MGKRRRRENNKNVVVVVVVVEEENNRNVVVVVVYRVHVRLAWGRCDGGKITFKKDLVCLRPH